MGAFHSLHKSLFVVWATYEVYGYYNPQWRVNFNWWMNWEFIEPNPELWERHEEYAKRYVYDKLIHNRDFITQGGESHFHKWFCGRENEGDWWGSQLPPYDEVIDQIYRTEARGQRKNNLQKNCVRYLNTLCQNSQVKRNYLQIESGPRLTKLGNQNISVWRIFYGRLMVL
eukprot:UN29378